MDNSLTEGKWEIIVLLAIEAMLKSKVGYF